MREAHSPSRVIRADLASGGLSAGSPTLPRGAVIRAPQVGLQQPVPLTRVHQGATTDEAPGGLADAQPRSAETQAELEALREQARQAGFEEGQRDGYAAGRAAADAEMAGQVARLATLVDSVFEEHAAFYRDAERQVIDLALGIARRVVEREVENVPDLALGVLRAALEELDAQTLLRVRVSPEDEEIVQRHWHSLLPSSARLERVELIADPRVQGGGAVLETIGGRIDAQPEIRLEMLAESLHSFADERGEDGDA